ncbi:SMI1/KNR4 family protein [Streptomyces sp. NRRL F-5135]|uniref:SMI1/KNR4 family protein n=1 Tax=Streptomyces sp. NRRL F-5135 TaxID=1463858 RepID=UPI00068AC750|nr:SMI1/KNR4 family protein [Streptomyces sp. NRRL F-5135]
MNVDILAHVRDAASQLGAGVPYALKVLAGQLTEDPDMGRASGLHGILTVMVDGDVFEDCPALAVGYIHEPDRIEIRYVNPVPSAEPVPDAQDQGRPADPVAEAVTGREVADAWQRIIRWLQHHAPDSHAALRADANLAAVAALEHRLGVRIPVGLRALWLLTAGDAGVGGGGFLPSNEALMTLDEVAAFHRQQVDSQAHEDTLNARRPEHARIIVWKAAWIPVVALGPADRTSGLYG